MNCENLLRLLTEYSEGAASGPLCAEIERHLAECRPCAELQHDLVDLRRLCRQSPTPSLPEETRRRIEELLRGPEKGASS